MRHNREQAQEAMERLGADPLTRDIHTALEFLFHCVEESPVTNVTRAEIHRNAWVEYLYGVYKTLLENQQKERDSITIRDVNQ